MKEVDGRTRGLRTREDERCQLEYLNKAWEEMKPYTNSSTVEDSVDES